MNSPWSLNRVDKVQWSWIKGIKIFPFNWMYISVHSEQSPEELIHVNVIAFRIYWIYVSILDWSSKVINDSLCSDLIEWITECVCHKKCSSVAIAKTIGTIALRCTVSTSEQWITSEQRFAFELPFHFHEKLKQLYLAAQSNFTTIACYPRYPEIYWLWVKSNERKPVNDDEDKSHHEIIICFDFFPQQHE